MNSSFSPIALFVYARPKHTRQVLESLARNPEAKYSVLYIFADGPKASAPPAQREAILEVRKLIREQAWCGDVRINESTVNRGLADSIVGGVTEVVAREGRVIVLEDDLVVHPSFLRYMNDSLELYQDDSRVMHVGGFVPDSGLGLRGASTFFSRFMGCWGWATWERAWLQASWDPAVHLECLRTEHGLQAFDLGSNGFFTGQLEDLVAGRRKTWAILWYASIFRVGGLCLYPCESLVRNIGLDGSGTNCGSEEVAQAGRLAVRPIRVQRRRVVESRLGRLRFEWQFRYGTEVGPIDVLRLVLGRWKHRFAVKAGLISISR